LNRGKIPYFEVSKVLSSNRDSEGNFIPIYHCRDCMDERQIVKDDIHHIAESIAEYTFKDYLEHKFVDIHRKRYKEADPFLNQSILKWAFELFKDNLDSHLLNTYKAKYNVNKLSQVPAPIAPVATIPIDRIISSFAQGAKKKK
jgi:hypothetical protein